MIEPNFEFKIEKETPDFGVFIIEPLQQGFGNTLGNALRRVLLSSLPGAAITQVRISGVRHQFSTITGLKEDVIELILNIKKIRIDYQGDKPQKIRLEKEGPGEIKAGDIETPPEVKIINKDLVLGILAEKKSKIKVEMVVERGLGYSPAEERPTDEIGVIPVDAIFSPVTRVNYQVSATRVGRMINWDSLRMEIWTDGTINPGVALIESAKVLISFFQQLVNPKKEKKEQTVREEKIPKEVLNLSVEELELPTRIANALIKGGFSTVAEMIKSGKSKIVGIRNLGTKSIKIVEAALKQKGVELPE